MNGETVLETVAVPYGSDAVYSGETPIHPSEPDKYTFLGWDPDGTNVIANTDCQPVWLGKEGFTRQIIQRTISGSYENSIATTIEAGAFAYCTNLESASFSNVLRVYNSAFRDCTSLNYVYLPKVSYIYNYAFYNCRNLSTVIIGTDNSQVCSLYSPSAFYGTPSTMTFYVSDNLVNSYKINNSWSIYKSQISGISYLPSE